MRNVLLLTRGGKRDVRLRQLRDPGRRQLHFALMLGDHAQPLQDLQR